MAALISTVIIPVLGRLDLLERCVRSLPEVRDLIIIDNGDDLAAGVDPLPDWLFGARVWSMPNGLSVAASWNLGIKATPFSDGWLLLNADAYMIDDAWTRLEQDASRDAITLAGHPGWCCAHIGARVVERVGLFCEKYHPAYMEDIDYQRRAEVLGVTIRKSDAAVGHDNSSTIHSSPARFERNQETHAANIATYHRRWSNLGNGGLPQHEEWSLRIRLDQAWE